MRYHRLSLRLPTELEDAVTAELWARGTLGLELLDAADGWVRVDAYFDATAGETEVEEWSSWRERGVEVLAREELAAQDWLATYREHAKPFDVGRRLRLDPRDADERAAVDDGGRILLRVPARAAFGTGSHESTSLALELLEDLELDGRDILDVGCGSGILSFAALAFGARSATAFDVDSGAVLIARQNARLNRLAPRFFAGPLAALGPGPRFDLALVNVLPANIRGELPGIAARLRPGAHAISSGNLVTEQDDVLAAWAAHGLEPVAERRDGEWIAFRLTT